MKKGYLADGPFTLDQLVTFETSSTWYFNQEEPRAIKIVVDESMPAVVQVEVESHDIPEWIEAERLDYYLDLPEGKYHAYDTMREGIEDRIFCFPGETERGNPVFVWKRGMVLGDYFRIVTFALQISNTKLGTPELTLVQQTLLDCITTLTFAPEVMPTDRIAPTPMLKQTSVSTVLRFRVPGPWRRGRLEEWTTFDSGDARLGVFEAKFTWFPFSTTPEPATCQRLLTLLDRDHPGVATANDWLVFTTVDEDFTPPARCIVYRKLFFQGEWDVLDVWFCYRVDARQADDPEVEDLAALFDREIRQAVVSFPEREEAPGAVGG